VVGWKNAIEQVLQSAQPSELWLVQADTIAETVAYMKSLQVSDRVLREISMKEALEGPASVPTNIPGQPPASKATAKM
jgi:hypothetical protein